MSIFTGSGVALITPFKKSSDIRGNRIDYETLEKLIEYQIENNTDAIIICGTTGEAATMSYQEKISCIKRCVEIVNKRIPVIAGVGNNDTRTAINLSLSSKKLGVDALLIVTPYYNKTSQEGLINAYYGKIASNVNIPIILYNVPSRTGVNILPKTAQTLHDKYKNIVGIKEASGNISQIAELASISDMDIYSGNDDQNVAILSLGGIGAISVLANVYPKETHDMIINYLNGNTNESRNSQLKMLKLCKELFCDVNPIPVKALMESIGMIPDGTLREPLISLSEDKRKILLKEYNALKK